MAQHIEINPDPKSLPLSLADRAMAMARGMQTSNTGTIRVPTGNGNAFIAGKGAQDGANWIDANGKQLPLIDTSRIEAEAESASKKADEAIKQGEQIRQDAQAGVDDARKQAQDAAAKAEQVRTDTASAVQSVKSQAASAESKAQNASEKADKLAGSITQVTATVNGHSTQLKELSTKVEGAVSANGETVKSVTELKQTVTGLSATVSQNSKTATDALSKATSVEATANGLKTQVTQNSKTASDALSKATSVEQTANGITATLAKDYQTTKQADGKYSTKTELSATAEGLSSKVAESTEKADSAMGKATTVEQTAKGLSTQITETARKADTATATANTAKSTADSNSQRITQTANTASSALSKATTVEQSLNGFKTSVQTSYQPWSMSDELVLNGLPDPSLPSWTSGDVPLRDGCYERTFPGGENHAAFSPYMRLAKPVLAGHRYLLSLEARVTSGTWADGDRFVFGLRDSWNEISVKGLTSAWRLYQGIATPDVGTGQAYLSSYAGSAGAKTVQMRRLSIREVTWEEETYASKTSLTQTADSIKASVAENARKADAAMSKASSVEQTAGGLSTRISEVARKGDRTVQSLNTLSADVTGFKQTVQQTYATGARVSRLESGLDGFKSTVSQTYSPKSEVTNLAASTVRRYGLNMNGAAAWHKIGYWRPIGHGSVAAIHVYAGRSANGGEDQNSEFTIMLKKGWSGSSNNHRSDYGVNLIRQRNAADVQVKALAFHPSGQDPRTTPVDIWIYQPWAYGGGHYDVSYDGSWSHCTTVQTAAPVEDSTHTLQVSVGYETLSNTSYVDQTSRSVSLGVVEEYKNGQHGSSLATKSDITAAKDSITSTVSSTYATKAGVTQEISSKITQNNNSLDVRFATKTETKTARDTANTANSHASDAQSRVGSLESCIRMTSAGVRVGHIVNGGFQGYSALLNSAGSFDVLDRGSSPVARFDAKGLTMTGGRLWLNDVPQHRDPALDWEGGGNGGFSIKLIHFGGRMFLIRASTTVRVAHAGAADYKITDALPYSFIYTRIAGYLHVNGLPVGTAFGLVDGKTLYISTEDYGNEVSQEISGVAIVSGL